MRPSWRRSRNSAPVSSTRPLSSVSCWARFLSAASSYMVMGTMLGYRRRRPAPRPHRGRSAGRIKAAGQLSIKRFADGPENGLTKSPSLRMQAIASSRKEHAAVRCWARSLESVRARSAISRIGARRPRQCVLQGFDSWRNGVAIDRAGPRRFCPVREARQTGRHDREWAAR